jgi:uracil-DNA glycosylase family 4
MFSVRADGFWHVWFFFLFLYIKYLNGFSSMNNNLQAAVAALNWYLDHGVDEALENEFVKRVDKVKEQSNIPPALEDSARLAPFVMPSVSAAPAPLEKSDVYAEAVRLAAAAGTLDELREAIRSFEGIAIKKTATNLVFSDGNPQSPVMLVGEAPGADEDRLGKPFVGVSGQLLDRIFKWIDLDRKQEDPKRSLYISNILNWRPPGNRTPAPGEVDVSLPFIEKHIALVNPKILILCGGVSAKALLGSGDSISKLRKSWRTYNTITPGLGAQVSIPCLATYHPAYLLRTPSQKKAVWEDMLSIDTKRAELGQK